MITKAELNGIKVKKGWIIGFNVSSCPLTLGCQLALDTQKSYSYNDLEITANNVTQTQRFLINAHAIRNYSISTFKRFNTTGYKSFNLTIRNSLITNSNLIKFNMSVLVDEEIVNLRIIEPLVCILNKPCVFDSAWELGNPLSFSWNIGANQALTTNSSSISLIFNTSMTYLITLTAANRINKKATAYALFTPTENLSGLYLYSGSSKESASVTSTNANFKFMLINGNNYECEINFGESTPSLSFTDDPINYNNSLFSHVYDQTGIYTVTIACNNIISLVTKTVMHYVQNEITGLKLLEYGVSTLTPLFQVNFKFLTGSMINDLRFYFENQLDSSLSFDSLGLVGKSSVYKSPFVSNLYNVTLYAFNFVSSLSYTCLFEISTPILGPVLNLTPLGSILTPLIYEFNNSPIKFTISLASGSNVRVQIYFGDEKLDQPTFDSLTPGEWKNNYEQFHVYSKPGDFSIKVIVSNAISSFVIERNISVISRLDNIDVSLTENPVKFKDFGGNAEFLFRCNATKAGSHAFLTFWSGDSNNFTNGPFYLNMDFDSFTNRYPFMCNYESSGVYKPVFYLENPLGSKYLSLTVNVTKGMIDGFYLDVQPIAVTPGQSFNVSAYVYQGDLVKFLWEIDGQLVKSTNQSSLNYHLPDTEVFTALNQTKICSLKVTAYNQYSKEVRYYDMEIQNPISGINVLTSPPDFLKIIDLRSNLDFFNFYIYIYLISFKKNANIFFSYF